MHPHGYLIRIITIALRQIEMMNRYLPEITSLSSLVILLWCIPAQAQEPLQAERSGFHFQVAFGWGVGPESNGLFHNMEIGGTLENGWTLAYNHVFIQNKGFAQPAGGPDLVGGHLFLVKAPLSDQWVLKFGAGPGGIHIQDGGIEAEIGLGLTYGADYHFLVTPSSGVTLGLTGIHAFLDEERHYFGAALSVGYTWF